QRASWWASTKPPDLPRLRAIDFDRSSINTAYALACRSCRTQVVCSLRRALSLAPAIRIVGATPPWHACAEQEPAPRGLNPWAGGAAGAAGAAAVGGTGGGAGEPADSHVITSRAAAAQAPLSVQARMATPIGRNGPRREETYPEDASRGARKQATARPGPRDS